MTACIVGWGHTAFGKHEDEDVESLVVQAARQAVDDAGIAFADVDEIVLAQYGGAFSAQGFPSSLALQADDAQKPTASPISCVSTIRSKTHL